MHAWATMTMALGAPQLERHRRPRFPQTPAG